MIFTKLQAARFPWMLLTVEAFLVVVSVLLALGVNSWRQSQAEDELAQRAIQSFISEISINCRQIMIHQPYHQAVVDGDREPNGLHIEMLRNDAWDVVKTTGAAQHIDHDIVARLVEISSRQADHRSFYQAYVQALFSIGLRISDGEQWHFKGERVVISTLASIQMDLIKLYQSLAEVIDKQYGSIVSTENVCNEN